MSEVIYSKLTRRTKILILFFIDILIINLSYLLAISVTLPGNYVSMEVIILSMLTSIIVYTSSLYIFKMYKSIWINAGIHEIINCSIACFSGGIVNFVISKLLFNEVSLLINLISVVLITILCNLARLSLRIISRVISDINYKNIKNKINILVIGAGECGATIIREIKREKSDTYNIVGIIDDDKNKYNTFLNGIKVLGDRNKINEIVLKNNIKEIMFAIAKIDLKDKRELINICSDTKCEVKVIPGIYELLDGKVSVSKMRSVDLKDLLGREEIVLDKEGIKSYIKGKTILVTGGGGSIGSELCRQIALYEPKKLLILDIYENNAYDLQNELSYTLPNLDKEVIIASVRDKQRLNSIFSEYKPDVVFHAAAHKHVPLMEANPSEAIKNNVLGTLNVVRCASQNKVKKFVLISTDKAVNPTNVMGATKRLCEIIVQAMNCEKNNVTEFVAVRFGNVLGSNGSVIPLFKKQIKQGGPVTLTHKDITRYFMLIPEAAQLVLQAGAYAKGGEIFVLDMGEPVRIYDLAEKLIRLSGFTPNEDIKIEIIGLRPGEKLYEELLINKDDKNLSKTENEKIFIDKPIEYDLKEVSKKIDKLIFVAKAGSNELIVEKLKEIVPTYICPECYNAQEINKKEIAATLAEKKRGMSGGSSKE